MTHPTKAERDELRKLLEKASPPPWGKGGSRTIAQVDADGKPLERGQRSTGSSFPLVGQAFSYEDRDLIAVSRNSLPSLLDSYEEALRVIRGLRANAMTGDDGWHPDEEWAQAAADKILKGE